MRGLPPHKGNSKSPLELGEMQLSAGLGPPTLRVPEVPGESVMDLRRVRPLCFD